MLGLLNPTDPAWIEAVEADLNGLLQDHAQCELKAAHTALSLIGRYGAEVPALIAPLVELAKEESDHVNEVSQQLDRRGEGLGQPETDQYVRRVTEAARTNRHDNHPPLLDRLLVAALIEGRSCERFRLLSERLRDSGLRTFYRDLMASEARHFNLYLRLADDQFGRADARARFSALAEREGQIATSLPLTAQVHG